MDINKLKTVKNYARLKDVTPQAVYSWIRQNIVASVKIDGVTFIVVE